MLLRMPCDVYYKFAPLMKNSELVTLLNRTNNCLNLLMVRWKCCFVTAAILCRNEKYNVTIVASLVYRMRNKRKIQMECSMFFGGCMCAGIKLSLRPGLRFYKHKNFSSTRSLRMASKCHVVEISRLRIRFAVNRILCLWSRSSYLIKKKTMYLQEVSPKIYLKKLINRAGSSPKKHHQSYL